MVRPGMRTLHVRYTALHRAAPRCTHAQAGAAVLDHVEPVHCAAVRRDARALRIPGGCCLTNRSLFVFQVPVMLMNHRNCPYAAPQTLLTRLSNTNTLFERGCGVGVVM